MQALVMIAGEIPAETANGVWHVSTIIVETHLFTLEGRHQRSTRRFSSTSPRPSILM
jgi:hypothetical protein